MKQIEVSFIRDLPFNDFTRVSELLDLEKRNDIDNLLWSNTGYKPEASFYIAYTADAILLKYVVREKYVKAVYREINDPVYKDSCVEMFIAFNDNKYYNLEFNYIGTVLGGYGAGKHDRTHISKELLEKITSRHIIKTGFENDALTEWELTLNIPFSVFEHHDILSLKNQVCNANFYKCGDELPEPHFLSWSNIINPHPDFHLPAYFGKVKFV